MKRSIPRWLADLSLVAVCCIWGLTFVSVKNALNEIAPFSFNTYRFFLASLLLFLCAPRSIIKIRKKTMAAGALLGLFLFGGYSFQTVGMLFTTVSNAGFLTGISVVIVPVALALMSRSIPAAEPLLGTILAFSGVGVLSYQPGLEFNPGDVLIVLCAVCFAMQIIYVDRLCQDNDLFQLVFVQVLVTALLSFVSALFFEQAPSPVAFSRDLWIALFVTAALATTAAFFIQAFMQRFTTPVRTAIIFSTEPIFAAIFAVWLLGEKLSSRVLLGGVLVFCGMLLSESRVLSSRSCSQAAPAKRGE